MPTLIAWILKNIPLIISVIRELLALLREQDKEVKSSGIKEAREGLRSRDSERLREFVEARRFRE